MARSHPLALSALCLVAPALAASFACRGDEPRPGADPQAPSEPRADLPPPSPVASAPAPTARLRRAVAFDLAKHAARFELGGAGVRYFELGDAGDTKYTLGGFRTGSLARRREGSSAVAVAEGGAAKLAIPVAATATQLVLRGRAAGRKVAVHVGELRVGAVELPEHECGVASVALGAEVPRGEGLLQLRLEGGRGALVLDAIATCDGDEACGRLDFDGAGRFASTTASLPPSENLRVPTGVAPYVTFEVPADATFNARVQPLAPGREATFTVRALEDGAPAVTLARVRLAGDRAHDVDAPLAGLAGHLVALSFEAEGADVELAAPRVHVPLAPSVASASAATPRPAAKNAIVFLVDTLRADRLRALAPATRVETPRFDAFAREAVVFERAASPENWTKPSVASVLSGLYPWHHHATTGEAVLPSSVPTLATHLRARGFHTGAFVANGYVSDKFGFDRGFRFFRNYIREGLRTQAEHVVRDVEEFLDRRPTERPFFLYVHTIDPHVPYLPPARFLAKYDDAPYDGPIDFARDRGLLEKVKAGSLRTTERDRQRIVALYEAEVSYHDAQFGRLLDVLSARGLDRDTVVVFTADHGEELFDHGSVGHGHSVHEELLHVPLAIRAPGVGGRRVTEVASTTDVAPTVLALLGAEPLVEADGTNLGPYLSGETVDAPRAVPSGFMDGWRAVRSGRYKLVHRTAARLFAYDLAADPLESVDLAPTRPLLARHLRGLLGLSLATDAGGSSSAHRAETTAIDPATDAQLRALGYVGTSRPR